MDGAPVRNKTFSWKDAFFASPGPQTLKSALLLYVKGICMGSADIIPGVSGGTIALITGIYEKLLLAIKSVDTSTARKVLAFDIKGAIAGVHIRFASGLINGIRERPFFFLPEQQRRILLLILFPYQRLKIHGLFFFPARLRSVP